VSVVLVGRGAAGEALACGALRALEDGVAGVEIADLARLGGCSRATSPMSPVLAVPTGVVG
jgi:hypothetical protein